MLKDGRLDGCTDDGQKVINKAHPEHISGELKMYLMMYAELVH